MPRNIQISCPGRRKKVYRKAGRGDQKTDAEQSAPAFFISIFAHQRGNKASCNAVDNTDDRDLRQRKAQFANQIGFPKEEVDDLVDLVKNYVDYLTEIAAKVLLIN